MGVPDIIAAPIARGYEDGEFDQAWLHSGSPAQVVRHPDGFQAEIRTSEIHLEWRVIHIAVARTTGQQLRELLLLGREFVGRDHWKARLVLSEKSRRHAEGECK